MSYHHVLVWDCSEDMNHRRVLETQSFRMFGGPDPMWEMKGVQEDVGWAGATRAPLHGT